MPIGFPGIGNGGNPTNIANANLTGTTTATGPLYVTDGLIGAYAGTATPIILSTKPSSPNGVTVLTAGSPADIATIAIPAGITRWRVIPNTGQGIMLAESASGTLAAGTIALFDGAGGTGNAITVAIGGPSVSGGITGISGSTAGTMNAVSSSGTIYIRQTVNSVNAGALSFYITILPLL